MLRWILRLVLLLGALGCFILASLVYHFYDEFQLGKGLTRETLTYPIIITDRYGEELHRIFGTENREWIELKDISPDLQKATILAEDERFYEHIGVDIKGVFRALWYNFQGEGYAQGASTLTQQIARKVHLNDQKTVERKLREIAIALGMETVLEKDEILEMYLNTVPYGPRVNGVKLASETYFAKKPEDLTLPQALILAALPKDPVRLSQDMKVGQSPRVKVVMAKLAQKEAWDDFKIKSTEKILDHTTFKALDKRWTHDDFQHWRFYVLDFLQTQGLEFSDYPEGLIIQTSLDKRLQSQLYRFLLEEVGGPLLNNFDIENFAFMVLDHDSRGPLVWIGSKQFWNPGIDGQVDILRSRRQVGSSIKPFIYALALSRGYGAPTLLSDTPILFKNDTYQVSNADEKFYGRMTLGDALVWSRNIPAVKALYLAGGEKMVRQSLDAWFGFEINKVYPNHGFGWALALGAVPLRVSDLANAYASLGSGERRDICPVLQMRDSHGKVLPSPCVDVAYDTIDPQSAFLINAVLSDTQKRPWRWSPIITPPAYPEVAVKTGTASKRIGEKLLPTDNIVAGYTPKATMVLWAGNADGSALREGSLSVNSIGATWRDLATQFFQIYPEKYELFEAPESLKDRLIKYREEWTIKGYQDKPYNELYRENIIDRGEWFNDPDYVAPVEFEVEEENEVKISEPQKTPSQVKSDKPQIDKNKIRERIQQRRMDRMGY